MLSSRKKDDLIFSNSLAISSVWLLSPVSSPPSRMFFLPRVLENKQTNTNEKSMSLWLQVCIWYPHYLLLPRYKFKIYLNNSYSLFTILFKYHLSQQVSISMPVFSCQAPERFSYYLCHAISVLEKNFIIYMLFTLPTVISLSAGPVSLLISVS